MHKSPYQFIDISGVRIRFLEVTGHSAECPLLILNGLGMRIESILPLVEQLHPRSVITLDIPGIGESACLPKQYGFAFMASIIEQFLHLRCHDQVDLLGISWGGGLAQQYAKDYPTRVNKLILAATSPGFVMVPGVVSLLWRWPSKKPSKMMFTTASSEGSRALLKSQWHLVKQILASLGSKQRRGFIQQVMATVGWTSFHWLSQLKQPTLVLMGDNDLVTPALNAKLFQQRMPNVETHILPGDHFFLLSSRQKAASIMTSFLD